MGFEKFPMLLQERASKQDLLSPLSENQAQA